jgi:hypothetical protein
MHRRPADELTDCAITARASAATPISSTSTALTLVQWHRIWPSARPASSHAALASATEPWSQRPCPQPIAHAAPKSIASDGGHAYKGSQWKCDPGRTRLDSRLVHEALLSFIPALHLHLHVQGRPLAPPELARNIGAVHHFGDFQERCSYVPIPPPTAVLPPTIPSLIAFAASYAIT